MKTVTSHHWRQIVMFALVVAGICVVFLAWPESNAAPNNPSEPASTAPARHVSDGGPVQPPTATDGQASPQE